MDTSDFFNYPNQQSSNTDDSDAFFSNATDQDWQTLLSFTSTRRFEADDLIISRGDTDNSLSFIAEGELEVLIEKGFRKKLSRLACINTGSIIGEQSFLDKQPRSVHIRAITQGQLFRLDREAFTVLSARHPNLAIKLLHELARILSLRLRNTTKLLMRSRN